MPISHRASPKKYRPRQLRAGFLPLSSITSGSELQTWFDFLLDHGLNAWAMLPIAEPASAPYRTTGLGVASLSGSLADDLLALFSAEQISEVQARLALSEADWLWDYATFQALASNFGETNWSFWPPKIRHRQPEALARFQKLLHEQITSYYQNQLRQLVAFRLLALFAKNAGLKLVGDLPFYLGFNSFIPWVQPYLFQLDPATKEPLAFSGVPHRPTEPFTRQLWGHPLYDWLYEVTAIAQLFRRRLQHLKTLGFHTIRLDHVMGFFHYGALKSDDQKLDRRLPGPGPTPLLYLVKRMRAMRLNFYFEDLAADNQALLTFMQTHQIPGLQVLTLSYDRRQHGFIDQWADLRPVKNPAFPPPVIYTSSHDTPTLFAWLTDDLTLSQREQGDEKRRVDGVDFDNSW